MSPGIVLMTVFTCWWSRTAFARSRKITEVRDLGTEIEVSDGVKPGDQVVLVPPVDLEDGSKMRVRATLTAKSS
jgi:hypothetical protein